MIEQLKNRIDARLNDCLCEMKEGYDDSVVGFNEAWDIVRKVFAEREEEFIRSADGSETVTDDKEATIRNLIAERNRVTRLASKLALDIAERDIEIERLRAALRDVVDDILDYERTMHLAPNPGRKYCWDSIERAIAVLEPKP